MVSRLQRPVWVKALRERACPRTRCSAICERIAAPLRRRGRRARSPACSATSSPAASPTASTSAAPTASTDAACASSLVRARRWRVNELSLGQTRSGDHRRRRHDQRHLHVHVLQQDAGAVADRRLPAVRRRGRRHDARRGPRHGRAQAARRRRARRRPDLRRDPRHRHVVRRAREERLRAACPTGQAKALRRAYDGAGLRARDRRAGRGARHRHEGRRRGRVRRRCASVFDAVGPRTTGSGARSAR